jgi:predicted nuclease of predicted toxin-antitoxin system
MIFLIDAQLPRRLARILQQYGHQAYHTLDLPQQNRTDDDEIMQFADMHDCIVTTKDSDFVDAFSSNIVHKSFGCSPQEISPTATWKR